MSLVAAASVSSLAWAGSPKALSDTDARAYAAAFQAMEEGDFVGAVVNAAARVASVTEPIITAGIMPEPSSAVRG